MSRVMSAPSPMTGSANMSGIIGQPPDQGQQQQVNMAEEIRAVMRQIRELMSQIDGIATQFPVASEKFDAAKTGLIDGMKAIVANQTGPEPAASPSLG